MKISLSWLRQLINIQKPADEIAALLTASGLEVENVEIYEQVKGGLAGLVVAEVLSCEKHPGADKLKITSVDIGKGEKVPIVCGADNVAVGQKVVAATVGTTLYPTHGEPFDIKKAKIRGEVSEGMICAEDEIGLGNSHAGIMVLDTDLPNGTPAAIHFKLENDHVLEIGLTPNRADAASHLGVARDLKALTGGQVLLPSVADFKVHNHNLSIEVEVENISACPRYSGVTISGLEVKESPEWLKSRLKSIGLTPINNVVDATNYVLHELGQPLHAFDAGKINGNKIIVKTLPSGTAFMALDEKVRKLQAHDLMICNAEEGMCIAGVFGGFHSGVSDATTSIFLESACFSPDYIRKTAQHHGLKTDASFRFERGTDPEMTVFALKRAAMFIMDVAGGEISSDIIDIYPDKIPSFQVKVSYKNIHRLIGQKIPEERIKEILERLDIALDEKTDAGFMATVPSYRVDVQREADIVEEVLRIYGYDKIEIKGYLSSNFLAEFPERDKNSTQLKTAELLAANGFSEVITNSLTKPVYTEKTDGYNPSENVVILNKLSEDLAVLRQALLFSGLEVIAYNQNRRQKDLKLFEFGNHYHKREGVYIEEAHLGIYMTGSLQAETWREQTKKLEFHDLAAVVHKILLKFNINEINNFPLKDPSFSYGLELKTGTKTLVKLGKIDKAVAQLADVKQEVFFADIHWAQLLRKKNGNMVFEEVPKFPEVRRDLSLVLDKQVTFDEIKKVAAGVGQKYITSISIFDVYEGEKVDPGKKAYALSFILQDKTKTLTDQVIDKTMENLMGSFEINLGAVIRK